MKALNWVRAGWGFARQFKNTKPFYLLYAAAFLVAGVLLALAFGAAISGLTGLLRGPSALDAAIKGALWLVPAAIIAVLAFIIVHVFVEVASYYRFARVKKAFSRARSALLGTLAVLLVLAVARGIVSGAFTGFGGIGELLGLVLSLYLFLAFLLAVPAYAFRRSGVVDAFRHAWQLFSKNSVELLLFVVVSWFVEVAVIVSGLIVVAAIVLASLLLPVLLVVTIPLAMVVLAYALGFANAFSAGALAAAYLNLSSGRRKSFRGRRRASRTPRG